MIKKIKNIIREVGLMAVAFTMVLIGFLAFSIANGWTEPGAAAPGGNVGAPINVSGIGQSKAGGLILNTGGAANGLLVPFGNVGIGTTNPAYKLDILGGSSSQIRLSNSDSDNTQKYTAIVNRDYKTANKDFLIISGASLGSANAISIGGGDASFNAATQLQFYTGPNNTIVGTERMRIDSSGNVGIGTNNMASKLTVLGKTTLSRDGASECCSNDATLALAENTAGTGKAAGISFHNGGFHEGTLQMAPNGWRRIQLLDH